MSAEDDLALARQLAERQQARELKASEAAAAERDLPMRVVHGSNPDKAVAQGFPDNTISNTKYTVWSFLPKNLRDQFSLHINRYFLFIACLQLFAVLTPVNPLSTWGPLVVIFGITATKEAIDDLNRRKEDKKANARLFDVVRNGQLCKLPSHEIQCGDVVKVYEDEEFPCDLVLLASSSGKQVYIQTMNLDGETSLKERTVLNETAELPLATIERFNGVVECQAPNAAVYKFDSRLWLGPSPDLGPPSSPPLSLSGAQLLQQTTSLANTDWVYGMAVYTGNETKFGKNRGDPPFKYTKVDHLINKVAIYLFIFQLGLVVIFGIVGEVWRKHVATDHWYLDYPDTDPWYAFAIIPLRFLLLNSTMIPISLKVTLDLCKLFYAKFINWDLELYDEEKGEPAVARNTSISEDLGQVEYVLTDKTGTLTQNNMVFKACSIHAQLYDEHDCGPESRLRAAVAEKRVEELEFLRHLALNHSVVPVAREDGSFEYRASSPDEVALVRAAAQMGVRLVHREGKNIHIEVNGKLERYSVLEELKFNSDRKRMSVAILNAKTRQIRLYCKGADDVLLARLRDDQDADITMNHLEVFARKGLRTLFFSYRDLDSQAFAQWKEQWQEANTSLHAREARLAEVYELLERDLLEQGCTAIEDKLQENVPETIATLRRANIKFWMLTGDKFSTALQIATACNLKSGAGSSESASKARRASAAAAPSPMSASPKASTRDSVSGPGVGGVGPGGVDGQYARSLLCQVAGDDREAIGACIHSYLEQAQADRDQEVVVIVRGSHLAIALTHYLHAFKALCMMAHTVICCRVTPSQKADLVLLVRSAHKVTLAIGDGGNDVAMIQQAHVGVGIHGKEGLQASRAADYTLHEFQGLSRLCLIHGRYSYLRTALVAQYSFYKSFMFCCVQICFGFVSAFSGSTLFNSLCITAYNAVLFVPIVTFIFDKDVEFSTTLRNPVLYIDCQRSVPFNMRTMFWWDLRGLYQGIVLFLFTVLTRNHLFHVAGEGYASDWETLGIVAYLGYLWIQSVTMSLELKRLTKANFIAIWGMHIVTVLVLVFTNVLIAFDGLNGYWIVNQALSEGQTWLVNLAQVAWTVVPVVAIQYWQFNYHPTMVDHLRDLESRKGAKVAHSNSRSSAHELV